MDYTDEFNELWVLYPKRAGGNSKAKAFRQWQARFKQGESRKAMREGMMRYKAFCEATGKIGTEYVMMAATFFGRDEHYMEDWDLPKQEIKETPEQKGERLGIVARPGESMDAYIRRIQQARG